MTKKYVNKLADKMLKDMPWHFISDILQALNYLNNKGMLHPPHDDAFLWDKEILEAEYPKICAEIRADERQKVFNVIKWNIEELAKRG